MKQTHSIVGPYESSFSKRKKFRTRCDTICDVTKGTNDPSKVTCLNCLRRMPDERLRRETK